MVVFKRVLKYSDYEVAKTLFREYEKHIGVDLVFQNFSEELINIRGQYGPPKGYLVLAYLNKALAGCFGIREYIETICELKRMYLRPQFHGMGIGKLMLEQAFKLALSLGYHKMRLDTLPNMQAAKSLYQQYGFYEIKAYRDNPFEGALFLEKILTN